MSYESMTVDEFRREFGGKGHRPQPPVKRLPASQATSTGPIEIELPLPPKALHPNARCGWKAKAAAVKRARDDSAFLAGRQRPSTPLAKANLQATFYLRRQQDDDNLIAWLKAYRDGLEDAGIVRSDADLTMLPIVQVVSRKESPRVVLKVVGVF